MEQVLPLSLPYGISVPEESLLVEAYKKLIGELDEKRVYLRKMASNMLKSTSRKEFKNNSAYYNEVYVRLNEEMDNYCSHLEEIVDEWLLPFNTTSSEKLCYYYWLCVSPHIKFELNPNIFVSSKGSCSHQRALDSVAGHNPLLAESTLSSYQKAWEACRGFRGTHLMRLKVAEDFSRAYFELKKSPLHALHVAKVAFDDALEDEQANQGAISEKERVAFIPILTRLKKKITLYNSLTV